MVVCSKEFFRFSGREGLDQGRQNRRVFWETWVGGREGGRDLVVDRVELSGWREREI